MDKTFVERMRVLADGISENADIIRKALSDTAMDDVDKKKEIYSCAMKIFVFAQDIGGTALTIGD